MDSVKMTDDLQFGAVRHAQDMEQLAKQIAELKKCVEDLRVRVKDLEGAFLNLWKP